MKICLLSMPFQTNTCLPLGIAYIKSYVEKMLPHVRVKNIDINMELFKSAVKEGLGFSCAQCKHITPSCLPPDILAKGKNLKAAYDTVRRRVKTKMDYKAVLESTIVFDEYLKRVEECYTHNICAHKDTSLFSKQMRSYADLIIKENPDLCGFSIIKDNCLYFALELAKLLKKRKDIPIVFGGPYLDFIDTAALMRDNSFIDYCIVGDGEEPLVKLISALKDKSLGKVPGLVYRSKGSVRSNGVHFTKFLRSGGTYFMQNLNELPGPDFSDFDLTSYPMSEVALPIHTSRSCYWGKCGYCDYYKNFRVKDIDTVIDEIVALKAKHNADKFLFTDPAMPPSRLAKLSDRLLERKVRIIYSVWGMRPEGGFTRALLKKAYASGLRSVFLGAETTQQRLLDLYDRGIKSEHISRILKDCYSLGIMPTMPLILGLPTATKKETENDINFIGRHLNHFNILIFGFELRTGSDTYKNPAKYGITLYTNDEGRTTYKTNSGISPEQALKMLRQKHENAGRYHFTSLENTIFGSLPYRIKPINMDVPGIIKKQLKRNLSEVIKDTKSPSPYHMYLSGLCYMLNENYPSALKQFNKLLSALPEGVFKKSVNRRVGFCQLKLNQTRVT